MTQKTTLSKKWKERETRQKMADKREERTESVKCKSVLWYA